MSADSTANRSQAASDTMMPADDERMIKHLVSRYADAVTRGDPMQWGDTWASECRFKLGQRWFTDRADAVAYFKQNRLHSYDALIQFVADGIVLPAPGGAVGRWLVCEIARRKVGHGVPGIPEGAGKDRTGVMCYLDRYVKEDGQWLFAERRLSVAYNTEETLSGTFFPVPSLETALDVDRTEF